MSTSQSEEEESPQESSITVSVSEDKMKAFVHIDTPKEDLKATAEVIKAQLSLKKISNPPILDDIIAWIENNQDETGCIEKGLLCEGKSPIPSVNGSIEWADDFFSTGFYIDPETGTIDFRQRIRRSSVDKDTQLATLTTGTMGENGIDVLGGRIPVHKPKNPKLIPGINVRKDETGTIFLATESGRVILKGDTLSVSDILVISGDIGLESGHISHKGSIEVGQDILEDSKVNASGDIEVRGMVEGSSIITEGNLYVTGGICGKEGLSIKVGGEIHAKFILDATIEAGGDIIVEREISHSTVHAQGAIRVPDGRIVGGETIALGGIELSEAGSDACVPTRLIPGVDFELQKVITEDTENINSLETQKTQIAEKLEPILPTLKSLSPEKKKIVEQLLEKSKSMTKYAEELEEHIQQTRNHSKESSVPIMTAQKYIFPEVKVTINNEHYHYKHTLTGPLKVQCIKAKIRTKKYEPKA